MEHKSISRLLLSAGAVVAVAAALVALWILPDYVLHTEGAVFPKVVCLILDAACVFFAYSALYRYALICTEIGKDKSFSRANVTNMGKIAGSLFYCGACCLLMAVPLRFLSVFWPEAIVTALACGGLGVIAYALSRLLDHAVSLQEENDLTV